MSSSPEPGRLPDALTPIAPLRSRPTTRSPLALTSIVGREHEVETVAALLRRDDVRLVTLTGPGGIGKTRIALAVSAAIEATTEFTVVWVALAPVRNPDRVLPVIARALGVGDIHTASLVETMQAVVRNRRLILIVDNCEQVLAAAAMDLAALLGACPTLTVLATSREALSITGEWARPMSPLSLPDPNEPPTLDTLRQSDAVRLFAERAAARSPAFALNDATCPLVATICRKLDGLPLAIELATARVSHISLAALDDRLTRRLPLLTGGPRDAPARLQTMRDAIAWSYDLLTETERAVFRRLAVFPDGFTLEMAEATVGHGAPDRSVSSASPSSSSVFDAVASLVTKSLLTFDTGVDGGDRYRMLEVIREFAGDELEANGETEAMWRAHADALLAWAEQQPLEPFAPEDLGRLAWLDAEQANLAAVIARLARAGTSDQSRLSRLAGAVGWFWFVRAHYDEGRAALEWALAGSVDPAPLRTRMVVVLGLVTALGGTFGQVSDLVAEELVSARAARNAMGAAQLLIVLGVEATIRGAYDEATARLVEADTLAAALDDLTLATVARGNLGVVLWGQGRLAEANVALEMARDGHRAAGSVRGEALALGDLGNLARARGEYARAGALYRDVMILAGKHGEPRAIIEGLEAIASLTVATGQPESAIRLLGAAERLREEHGVSSQAPRDRAAWEQAVATVRSTLGAEAFTAAWSAGRSLTTGEAVGEALDTLDVLPVSPVMAGIALSSREREVLRLLADGQSSRQIGEALFIGTRTVESHLVRIYAKLSVRTRTAAIAAAFAAGLILSPPPASPPTE